MSGSDEPSGMTAERVRSLEAIGFQWTVSFIAWVPHSCLATRPLIPILIQTTDPRHEPWEVRYEELRAFVVSSVARYRILVRQFLPCQMMHPLYN